MIEVHLHGALKKLHKGPLRIAAETPEVVWRACEALLPGFRELISEHKHSLQFVVDDVVLAQDKIDWPLAAKVQEIHITPAADGAEITTLTLLYYTLAAVAASVVISSFLVRKPRDGGGNSSSDLFDGPVVTTKEGGALPIVYGRVRVGPISASAGISSNATESGANSTARIVDLLCEGEIQGLVDGNDSVLINSTPLGDPAVANNVAPQRFAGQDRSGIDGLEEYEPASKIDAISQLQFFNGTANQAAASGIPTQETEIVIGAEITTDDSTPPNRRVASPLASRARVTLGGGRLTYQHSDGRVSASHFNMIIRWNYTDPESGAPVRLQLDRRVSGRYTSSWEKSFEFDFPVGSRPVVSVVRVLVSGDEDSPKAANAFSWLRLTEITQVRQTYPHTAYAALTISADRLDSLADRAYDIYGLKVLLPNNYSPKNREYEDDWDGDFAEEKQWTDNPAWCVYDILINGRYGLGQKFPAAMVLASRFDWYTIGRFCDELVPDGQGEGSVEPRYRFNVAITTRDDAIKELQRMLSVFDVSIYEGGGKLLPVQFIDRPPIALVAPANIEDGQFDVGSDRRERYSSVAVRWNDPSNNYRQTTELVVDDELVHEFGHNQISITAYACTHRGQAHRLGRHYFLAQEHEYETYSYIAGIDHVGVRPGDIVRARTRLPGAAGEARLYGRVMNTFSTPSLHVIETSTSLRLEPPFLVHWMKPNGEMNCCESVLVTANNPLYFSLAFDSSAFPEADLPLPGSMIIIETPGVDLPLLRIIDITERSKIRFDVNAKLHNPDRYALADARVALNEPAWHSRPSALAQPSATLQQFVLYDAVANVCRRGLRVSVTAAPETFAVYYEYQLASGSGDWETWITTPELILTVPGSEEGVISTVRVRAASGIRRSEWVIAAASPAAIPRQFAYSSTSGSAPVQPTSTEAQKALDSYVPIGFVSSAVSATEALPVVWEVYREGDLGSWCEWSQPLVRDIYGSSNDLLTGPDDPNGPPLVEAQRGQLYVQDDGTVWVRLADSWRSLLDLTPSDANKIYSGEVAAGAAPSPEIMGLINGDVYLATDGRWWAWQINQWVYRGDLTGPAGPDGIPGLDGADGSSAYIFIAYADSQDGTENFSLFGEERGYIGVAVKDENEPPLGPAGYTWTKTVGRDGLNGSEGLPGFNGQNGANAYIWIAYADSPDGSVNFTITEPGTRSYFGVAVRSDQAQEIEDYRLYTWAKLTGEDGVRGEDGISGYADPPVVWLGSGSDYVPSSTTQDVCVYFYRGTAEIARGCIRLTRVGDVVASYIVIDQSVVIVPGTSPYHVTTQGLGTASVAVTAQHVLSGLSVTLRAYVVPAQSMGGTVEQPVTTTEIETYYRAASSRPATPGSLTGWSLSASAAPATTSADTWSTSRTNSRRSGTIISRTAFSLPVIFAARLTTSTQRTQTIYRAAATRPSVPSAGTATGIPSGWSTSDPGSGPVVVWRTSRTQALTGGAVTVSSGWSSVAQHRASVTTLTRAQTVYRRSASRPTRPASSASTIPSGWSAAMLSATSTLSVWTSSRNITYQDGTPISATNFTTPILSEPAMTITTRNEDAWRLAFSRPATPVSAPGTYPPTSWLASRPARVLVSTRWKTSRIVTVVNNVATGATTWSVPTNDGNPLTAASPLVFSIVGQTSYSVSGGSPGARVLVRLSFIALGGAPLYSFSNISPAPLSVTGNVVTWRLLPGIYSISGQVTDSSGSTATASTRVIVRVVG